MPSLFRLPSLSDNNDGHLENAVFAVAADVWQKPLVT